jgi:ubiquinone/menaquinone biosynthesis C-methylase UbiE
MAEEGAMLGTSTLETTAVTAETSAVTAMPRGGPDASWLDRQLETSRLEYTERPDVPDETKQYVARALDRIGSSMGAYRSIAQLAVDCVDGIDRPRILELGAGRGRLSEHILDIDPTARVTISDIDPTSVASVAARPLGRISRVTTKVLNATAIAEPDASYDLVVLANTFHHLPPETAAKAIAEATRVGGTFLVVDLKRLSPLGTLLSPLLNVAATAVTIRSWAAVPVMVHDSTISWLRAYSPSALTALGHAAHPAMQVDFPPLPRKQRGSIGVTYRRANRGARQ